MSDETILRMDQVLRLPDGSPRPREEAIKLVGLRAVWLAELNEALARRQSGSWPLSIPRRIFLSYRWGTPDEDAWVERLAGDLTDRGNAVTLDRWLQKEDRPPTVPELVAGIADCHVFLAIIDPGYVERVGRPDDSTIADGWVFDEHQVAAALSNANRLDIVGLLRAGTDLPRGFRLVKPDEPGNTLDVRDPSRLASVLDALFPPTAPPPLPEVADEVMRLLQESRSALDDGRAQDAYAAAAAAAHLAPDLVDGHAQMAQVAYLSGAASQGLQASMRALSINSSSIEMLETAADCAYHTKDFQQAVVLCTRILPYRRSETAHVVIGNALDELGQVYAGAAHLEIAGTLVPNAPFVHNDTGVAYRHAGLLQKALICFERGLAVAPTDQGLLVNRAATAIEAGDRALAERALADLQRVNPDHPSIEFLGNELRKWLAGGGEPPVLLKRVPPREPVGFVTCTACAAEIPLVAHDEGLCTACGAEAFEANLGCDICGSEETVAPASSEAGTQRCPYCRRGTLEFRRS